MTTKLDKSVLEYEGNIKKECKMPVIPHEYDGSTVYCDKHEYYYYISDGCGACIREENTNKLSFIEIDEKRANQLQGMKFDEDKLRWDLLPIVPVEKIVEIITHGAKKYTPENWKKVDIQRFYAAGMRHLTAWKKGEEFDKDSGFTHLAHVGCNILFMMYIEENKVRHYPKNDLDHVVTSL